MTATSSRLMLYSKAQEVLGVEEATLLMDMLTPGEMFEARRSDTQTGFVQVRAQLEISETGLHRRIDETNRRLDALELKVDCGFDAVDRRLVEMEAKFDTKFETLENRIMTRMSRLILGVGIPFVLSNVAILVTLVART